MPEQSPARAAADADNCCLAPPMHRHPESLDRSLGSPGSYRILTKSSEEPGPESSRELQSYGLHEHVPAELLPVAELGHQRQHWEQLFRRTLTIGQEVGTH